jgi:hypothetical protein
MVPHDSSVYLPRKFTMQLKEHTKRVTNDGQGKDTFEALQQRFTEQYELIFHNDLAEKTVVVIPSLTLDAAMLRTIKGIAHYEERMLCMLMLLRMPRTHVIFVTSVPVDTTIIDYYLHLLPGITGQHARQRLSLLSCYDASRHSLTEKILDRPRLIKRIKEKIKNPMLSHMACFNVTEHELQLALQLDIPVFGANPALLWVGTKSGSRQLFREIGVRLPDGIENVADEAGIVQALMALKQKNIGLQKAVVKMNDGFSGEGNAIFCYGQIDVHQPNAAHEILERLRHHLKIVAVQLQYEEFMHKFSLIGGVVEAFVDGDVKTSPSVQCRINPVGSIDIISTHDQVMGGESGQVFEGAAFPADTAYSHEIAELGQAISGRLQQLGVIGRYGIDFLSVKQRDGWQHYAIEINLRKGGTTHPYMMLQFLTVGTYKWQEGIYQTPQGAKRCYFSSDNVYHEKFKGLTPDDLMEIAICNQLMYDGAMQKGVMFHMIGALSQYGKLGMVCIAETHAEALAYYHKTLAVLNRECGM